MWPATIAITSNILICKIISKIARFTGDVKRKELTGGSFFDIMRNNQKQNKYQL